MNMVSREVSLLKIRESYVVLPVKYRRQHCSDTLSNSILPVHEADKPYGGAHSTCTR